MRYDENKLLAGWALRICPCVGEKAQTEQQFDVKCFFII